MCEKIQMNKTRYLDLNIPLKYENNSNYFCVQSSKHQSKIQKIKKLSVSRSISFIYQLCFSTDQRTKKKKKVPCCFLEQRFLPMGPVPFSILHPLFFLQPIKAHLYEFDVWFYFGILKIQRSGVVRLLNGEHIWIFWMIFDYISIFVEYYFLQWSKRKCKRVLREKDLLLLGHSPKRLKKKWPICEMWC